MKRRRARATTGLSVSDPYPAALRLLARQGRSRAELEQKLLQKGYPQEKVHAAIARCLELGYLDDQRYARERAGALQRQGRATGRRLFADLKRRGIDSETAHAAMSAASEESPETDVLAALKERRFPDFNYATAEAGERRRVVNFFLRRGFSLALVLAHLQQEPER